MRLRTMSCEAIPEPRSTLRPALPVVRAARSPCVSNPLFGSTGVPCRSCRDASIDTREAVRRAGCSVRLVARFAQHRAPS